MADLTIEDICQALKLEAGQTLIVRISPDRDWTPEHVARMQEALAEHMPDHKFLIMVADEFAVADEPQVSADA